MGLFDKLKNEVSKAGSLLTNTAQNVTNEVNRAADNAKRSDIGKVVDVAARPMSTVIEIQKDLFNGKFENAGNRVIGYTGQQFSPWTRIIDMSPTAKGVVERDNFFGSYGKTSTAFEKLRSGQGLTNEENNEIFQTTIKSAALVGAGYAAPYASPWMTANPGTTSLVTASLLKGNYSDAAKTLANELAPGLGDNLFPPRNPTFESQLPYDGSFMNNGTQSKFGGLSLLILGAGVILILAIFKKMRS